MRAAATPSAALSSSTVTVGCATLFSLVAVALGVTCDQNPSRHERWTLSGTLPAEVVAARSPSPASPLQGGAKAF